MATCTIAITGRAPTAGTHDPYLTYNDLFTMQKTLLARNGAENPALRALMESKLRWMTQQEITGYFK